MRNRHFGNLLDSISERFDVRPSAKDPDIQRLERAMKGEVLPVHTEPRDGFVKASVEAIENAIISNKNPFDPTIEKSIGNRGGHDLYTPHPRNPENIFSEKFDYRKTTALYNSRIPEDEAQIMDRLNELLCESEISGLDEAEMLEVRELYRKVR